MSAEADNTKEGGVTMGMYSVRYYGLNGSLQGECSYQDQERATREFENFRAGGYGSAELVLLFAGKEYLLGSAK